MSPFARSALVIGALSVGWASVVVADLRDPTVPPTFKKATPEVTQPSSPLEGVLLQLSYIRIASDTRHAVINDRLVREGDAIEGVTVKRITPQQVQVERDGESRELRLYANALEATDAPQKSDASPTVKSGRVK